MAYIKHFFQKFCLAVTAGILFAGCTKEYLDLSNVSDEIQLDNWEGVFPLAYANFTLADLLEDAGVDDFVQTYDDNLLYLVFEEQTISQTANNIITIDDQTFSQVIEGSSFLPGVDRVSRSFNFNIMSFDRPRAFEEITLKSGTLNMRVRSEYDKTGMIILRFQALKPNGEQLIDTFHINDATGNYDETKIIDLSRHTIQAGNSDQLDTTYFKFTAEAILDDASTPPGAGQRLSVDINISNLDYSFVRGYFGSDTIILNDKNTISVDLISEEVTGGFQFLNPQLRVYIENSFGIPITLTADSLLAKLLEPDNTDSLQLLVFNPGSTTAFQTSIPHHMADNAGASKDTTVNLTENLANLPTIINQKPKKIAYNISTFTNLNTTPGPEDLNQFVTDTSCLKMKASIELPIDGYTKGYLFNDTIEADLADLLDASIFVDELTIQLRISNGLPLEIELQGTWLDSNYQVIDSVFASGMTTLVQSALTKTDPSEPTAYRTDSPTDKTSLFTYEGADIEKLSKARHIMLRAKATTWEGNNEKRIKIYTDNTFYVKLGAKLKARGNSRDIEKLEN